MSISRSVDWMLKVRFLVSINISKNTRLAVRMFRKDYFFLVHIHLYTFFFLEKGFWNPRTSKNRVLESGETSFTPKTNNHLSNPLKYRLILRRKCLQFSSNWGGMKTWRSVFGVKEVSPLSKTLFFELLGFQKPFPKNTKVWKWKFDYNGSTFRNNFQFRQQYFHILMLTRKRTFKLWRPFTRVVQTDFAIFVKMSITERKYVIRKNIQK